MSTLGQFFIELTVKGADKVGIAIEGVLGQLKKLDVSGKAVASTFVSTFKAASAAVTGLAAAGMVGTVEGNNMAFAWQRLSREIASIALPVFEAITNVVRKLTTFLQSLSGAQQ